MGTESNNSLDTDTLRNWLNNAGFDWDHGIILYSSPTSNAYCPGWDRGLPAVMIDSKHSILDVEFDSGFGAPQCPRIFARDERAVYFPVQYDGSTCLEKVVIDPQHYIDGASTPYPGG